MEENSTVASTDLERNIRVSVTEVQITTMVIGAFGIAGNSFSLFIFISSKSLRRIVTNQFLINQCCIDFLASLLILASLPIQYNQKLVGIGGYIVCVFWNSSVFVWTALLCSTFNLVALSIERWFMVTKPLLHKAYFTEKIGYTMMMLAWLVGILYQLSFFVPTSRVVDGICYTLAFWSSYTARKSLGVITFVVKLLVPVTIIISCYISMLLVLRKSANSGLGNDKRKQRTEKAQRNIFKTLVIVVTCFILCVSWNQVAFLLKNFELIELDYTSTAYNLSVIAYYTNCCINPVIYLCKYEEFKSAMRKILCKNRVEPMAVTNVNKKSSTIESNITQNQTRCSNSGLNGKNTLSPVSNSKLEVSDVGLSREIIGN